MKIKQTPEDFVVEEILTLKIEEGPLFYYKVEKRDWNTEDLVRKIASKLRIKPGEIGYAGLKDKNAVTTQYISLRKKIEFKVKDVELTFLGTGKQRVFLGMLEGNKFTITIRDLKDKLPEVSEVLNLFGEQRFSSKNVKVGKLLVKRDFKQVCELLELAVNGNDYVNALRSFGFRQLRFFIRAYQSFLWNRLARSSTKDVIPILGFFTEGEDYIEIMKEESITKKDFLIRSFPEISSEGYERARTIKVKDFKTLSFEEDELNQGKMKQVVMFSLPKGSYATVVIDAIKPTESL